MLNIEIRRPTLDDTTELNHFFRIVITDTFLKEGIGHMLEDIENEITSKEKYLHTDFESNGEKRYFLIASNGDQIIGSIEIGPASELINHCTNHALQELLEVGTVFVHPDFQRKGIGSMLLNAMYFTLRNRGIEEFCLDSGYTASQKIWKKKFGEPQYLLKNYWGEENDHMIWRVKLNDLL
ncbi:GNAT family N-acetyltransferase [Cytobacillus depressus]|uniref:GNAT family N-acetyltransferase n=1 Tax=Cytobacillus depressus TaxID=1602942 RepID=A0A6L3V5M4_9BACI|nr:GNAT family N-acetyltransferase [Cytobacillus depressus]KAB2334543.1 GNAT family N-acetyltransferase [Cytobacillus depressus]